LAVSLSATIVGFDRDRAFYPTLMIIIASYYGLFAVMSGSVQALTMESVVMAGFLLVSILGFKLNLWLLVGAWRLRFRPRPLHIKPRCARVVAYVLPDL
jgi:hypothetical protein